MRAIPAELESSLKGPATTLARAWRLTRRDGMVLAFTDHDEALIFAGTAFAAASGLRAGETEEVVGFSAGSQDVEGALSSSAITENDIAAGLYDEARVETFAVDWTKPDAHLRLSISVIGEIRRSGDAFTAELRSPVAALDRERGRIYGRRCDATLGDRRCGIDLEIGGRRVGLAVVAATVSWIEVEAPAGEMPAAFAGGTAVFAEGSPRAIASVGAVTVAGRWRIVLRQGLDRLPDAGEIVLLAIGCDKRFSTCRDRFANAVNFRGFPHLPGLDTALRIGKADMLHDGMPVVP